MVDFMIAADAYRHRATLLAAGADLTRVATVVVHVEASGLLLVTHLG